MPIDPNDPNLPSQPNDPRLDVNKYLNFDEMRQKIDTFFAEMLNQLQAPFSKAMDDMGKTAKDTFKEVGKEGKAAFGDVEKSGTDAFGRLEKVASDALDKIAAKDPLKDIGTQGEKQFDEVEAAGTEALSAVGKTGETAFSQVGQSGISAFESISKVAGNTLDELAERAKAVMEESDYKEIEARLIASRQAVNAAAKKEDAAFQKTHLSYLKEILSKEEYNIQQILAERDTLLDHIEEEYIMQRNNIQGEIKDQKERTKTLIALDAERERKKAQLRSKFAEKEKEARGEIDLGKVVKNKIMKDADDVGMKMLGFAKNLNFITAALGAAIAVFNMGVKETQRSARLLTVSRGALGTGPAGDSGRKAFDSMLVDFSNRGFKSDEIEEFITTLAESPKALKEAATKDGQTALLGFTDAMTGFGVDAATSMKLVATAGREWNMGTKDLNKTLRTAIGINRASGLSVKDSFNSLLNLNAQLRSLTFNGREAAKVLVTTAAPMKSMGFSDEEVEKFNQSLTQMLSSLSPSKLAGLYAFTQGRMPEREDFKKMANEGGQLQMVADTFLKVIGDKLGTSEGFFMIESLGKQLGFSAATSAQGAAAWEKILIDMKSGKAGKGQEASIKKQMDEFNKKFVPDDAAFRKIQEEGFSAMKNMKGPMDLLGAKISQLSVEIGVKLVPAIVKLNDFLSNIISTFSFGSLPTKQDLIAGSKMALQQQFPVSNYLYETIKKNIPHEASRERQQKGR